MLQIGSLVDNKYKILSEVGHGGMSVVYLAINERANKTWAVKEVRKDGVCDFEAVKQGLVVETDMLKKLNHPYLPSIIDVIDTEDSFLIVMDYIEGKSLQSVLKNAGAQPADKVRKWAIQLCDVLGYLHSREPAIIYRDMKPANVMLKPTGDITLIDFGTAREFKNRSMVEDTTCLGTRGYAAPEQFGGRGQTDARTDIYCLGATMYHLITGHSPAEPPYEIKPLSYWDVSFFGTGIEQIINKCCQQDPEARYQNCAELMYDLEHMDEMDLVTKQKRKHKWIAFVASVALFGVGVAGMLGFTLAKNGAVRESYDSYLNQAKMTTGSENFPTFVKYVQDAIEVDPGSYEAYDLLLSRVEEDGRLDMETEWSAIYRCLNDKSNKGSRTNESYLLANSKEEYTDIQLRMGKLLFLMSDGSNENLRSSVAYFDKALHEGGLENSDDPQEIQKATLADCMGRIGLYIDTLNNENSAFTEAENTYLTLWNDMQKLMDNGIESMGKRAYGIALYSRVASMIVTYHADFYSNGVTKDEMIRMLDQIENALNATNSTLTASEKNQNFGGIIEGALNNVNAARNQISGLGGVN